MLLTTLLVLTTLLPRLDEAVPDLRLNLRMWSAVLQGLEEKPVAFPVFQPEARAVSNWRVQAGDALRPASLALVARYAATEPAFVARCVKLNNYWCIKRARWNGEIGADAEGHTGFATAADGADAAAQLLRRYYREFGRRSALAIVRRWAPAECRIGGGMPAARGPSSKVSGDLAPRGIGRTLRARFLARNTRGGVPRAAIAGRGGPLRIQPWSPLARMGAHPRRMAAALPKPATESQGATARASSGGVPAKSNLLVRPSQLLAKPSTIIAKPSVLLVEPSVVLGQASAASRPETRGPASSTTLLQKRFVAESAALPAIAAGVPAIPLLDLSVPAPLCANDETRIRNYAARIAGSVGLKVDDDLALFSPEGRPLPNLRPVMLAMSSVELGSLRAGAALVEAAIARLDAITLAALSTRQP